MYSPKCRCRSDKVDGELTNSSSSHQGICEKYRYDNVLLFATETVSVCVKRRRSVWNLHGAPAFKQIMIIILCKSKRFSGQFSCIFNFFFFQSNDSRVKSYCILAAILLFFCGRRTSGRDTGAEMKRIGSIPEYYRCVYLFGLTGFDWWRWNGRFRYWKGNYWAQNNQCGHYPP